MSRFRGAAVQGQGFSNTLPHGRDDNRQTPGRSGRAARGLLWLYKYTLSPILHALGGPAAGCRFQPTCSEYAALAWHVHGPFHGSLLAGWRLLRCHPLARGGFDPVPGTNVTPTEKTRAI